MCQYIGACVSVEEHVCQCSFETMCWIVQEWSVRTGGLCVIGGLQYRFHCI